jgi:Domain of unknown function (DUF397)
MIEPSGTSKPTWQKSSRSGSNSCVEVAFLPDRVLVRDSKDRTSPVLSFTLAEWDAFVGGVREGELARP